MKSAVALIALVATLNLGASAFVPSPTQTAWGVTKTASGTKLLMSDDKSSGEKNELLVDDNFDDVNLVRLMGLKRLKKMARRHKRELNERIKNFEVVQDADGDWVPASPEQTAEMKAAAGAASVGAPVEAETVPKSAKTAGGGLKLIIAGAPASGKGTQCEMIKAKYGVVHLSTGDMLRAAVVDQTEVGKLAKGYMDAGNLVPDDVIIKVVKDRLDQPDCQKNGWLLDGFPRTPAQAEALVDAGVTADCFIFLNVPDEILVERVVGRRSDPETGKIYHMTFSPPEDEEVAARLVQRSDDTEEKVKVRLEQFHANVDAVKGSYTDIGINIDGAASPDEVSAAIAKAIDAKVAA